MAVKMSVNLPDQAVDALRELSERRGITMTEVLRRAIASEKFIEEETARGSKLLLEKPDKTIREIVFQ